ncbi:hypothetical protein BD311DRAFT_360778 [Dichomitus squalens]|uniref:Berberine/berberine-like domain-containing protein n=1 Tax=Dichomitus squalens TaxID=114155 RepID=A0A4Q9MK31_9APHY|nr:hypothetical protein BD311DRAFT_360778 [Dichomitus squalens]
MNAAFSQAPSMATIQPSRPDLTLSIAPVAFPESLLKELSASVKGPVLRPTDSEYTERAKTFNGKLKPTCRVLVSPLDAHDVSAVVQFCRKHDISPSVRAGGYGIAGWAVAGDLIIDMSMIRDIDIEPPVPAGEDDGSSKDWTPIGSKGKGRAPLLQAASTSAGDGRLIVDGTQTNASTASRKRRRDDRSPSPGVDEIGSKTGHGQFDGASHAVASFLRGPPLPPIPGDTPRGPPVNRQRLHSPVPPSQQDADHPMSEAPHVSEPDRPRGRSLLQPVPPPLTEDTRQKSGDSTTSTDSVSHFSASTGVSHSSDATSLPSPVDGYPSVISTDDASGRVAIRSTNATDVFDYLSSNRAPPMFGHTVGVDGVSTGVSAMSPFSMSRFVMPPNPGSGGVAAFNPMLGFSMSLPASTQYSLQSGMPMVSSGQSMPAFGSASSSMPTPVAMPGGPFASTPGTLGLSHAHAQAGQDGESGNNGQEHGRHLGNTYHSKPIFPHTYVTFGAGMRQKEVDLYTADHPFEGMNPVTNEREEGVVPYHVPMSAHPVGSSIMLLGGFGFISRMYGLSVDNLVEVEMVLADGRIVIVNAESDPDLWWAIRGAGSAFGIATRYKVRAFPVPVVFAGNLIYRFRRATAPSLIKHFRDCIKGCPRELYANVLLTAGPANKDSLVVIQMCYVGPKAKGMEYLQAISSWDGERCLLNEVNEKSFLNQQDSVAQVLRGQAGRQWFLRSTLVSTLSDEVINQTVLAFAGTPVGCTWIFELAGGAIGDFEDTCLPKAQREATWTVAALHQWDMGIDDPRCITTAEDWMKATISPVSTGGPLPTFLGRHESLARTKQCFGKNWDRLVELKKKYDPDCFFKNSFWPLDKGGQPIEPLTNEPPSP